MVKTLYPSTSADVCSTVEGTLRNTPKIGVQCSLKNMHTYLLILSKEKLCLKEDGFIILREFSV